MRSNRKINENKRFIEYQKDRSVAAKFGNVYIRKFSVFFFLKELYNEINININININSGIVLFSQGATP